MRTPIPHLALASLGFIFAAGMAQADVVFLRNGHAIEGEVEVDGDSVLVHVPGGVVTFQRREISSIQGGPSGAADYVARFRAIDPDDPDALLSLATWARQVGLADRAEALEALATGIELERRVAALRPDDARAWFDTYRWLHGTGRGSPEAEAYLLDRSLSLDPDFAPALAAWAATGAPAEAPGLALPPAPPAEDDADLGREQRRLEDQRADLDRREDALRRAEEELRRAEEALRERSRSLAADAVRQREEILRQREAAARSQPSPWDEPDAGSGCSIIIVTRRPRPAAPDAERPTRPRRLVHRPACR